MSRILIVNNSSEALAAMGDAGSTVIGITQEVSDADIVITPEGKLLKDRDGDTEVRVA